MAACPVSTTPLSRRRAMILTQRRLGANRCNSRGPNSGELRTEYDARKAGFEDRSRHRPRSSSALIYRVLTALGSIRKGI
jgi:hypothetical protein